MRKLRLLLMMTPLLLAFTCDDDPSDDTPSGTWSLMKVTGGIAGVYHEFPQHTITWKFSYSGGRTIIVENNNTENNNAEDFFDTGVYDYQYVDNTINNSCEHTTEIDGMDFGCQDIDGTTMTFTQQFADGYVLTFRRN